ncbi:hypothetical protein BDV34DRAFT_227509 [Aspergillus parasiticus]|uniref:Uncharacterized protein n=1 Tax=Aspergillus parasiticus TaxID=5067 RepID=A0A5N6DE52_ASPPA|nr:hypothetical protein BDV34DRAFT_227509 [Aspergillus parasiticus]
MGQRHNRRRTRPRSRNRSANHSPIELPPYNVNYTRSPAVPKTTTAACDLLDSISIPFAPTWHYGYTTWQKRDRTLRLEALRLEAEQCRLFGGEPGDDVGLCYRMLEYFGGLDYIDSVRDYYLGEGQLKIKNLTAITAHTIIFGINEDPSSCAQQDGYWIGPLRLGHEFLVQNMTTSVTSRTEGSSDRWVEFASDRVLMLEIPTKQEGS